MYGGIGGSRPAGKPGHCPGKILVDCAYCLPLYCLWDDGAEFSDGKTVQKLNG